MRQKLTATIPTTGGLFCPPCSPNSALDPRLFPTIFRIRWVLLYWTYYKIRLSYSGERWILQKSWSCFLSINCTSPLVSPAWICTLQVQSSISIKLKITLGLTLLDDHISRDIRSAIFAGDVWSNESAMVQPESVSVFHIKSHTHLDSVNISCTQSIDRKTYCCRVTSWLWPILNHLDAERSNSLSTNIVAAIPMYSRHKPARETTIQIFHGSGRAQDLPHKVSICIAELDIAARYPWRGNTKTFAIHILK